MSDASNRKPIGGMIRLLRNAAVAAIAALPTVSWAGEPENGTLSIVFENDLFYGTDRHYTNGVRGAWLSGPGDTPQWVLDPARRFPLFPEGGTVRVEYALGQSMYSPGDIRLENPPDGDRPYAGWLYGSVGLIAETGARLDQLSLTLGVVGPASMAEPTQKFIHRQVDSPDPRGWDTQLHNEPGLILTYQRSWRSLISEPVAGLSFDVTPHLGGAGGNVFTYANGGVMLRFGDGLLLDYGPPGIQPSLPGAGFFIPNPGLGWYLFGGIDGRAVARNIFLDGNTFRDSRRVDKEPLIADFQFGAAVTWGNTRLSYVHLFRTPEFKGQNQMDEYGGFSLSQRF
ncbi:hypothetical protein H261_09068 [Paramagnetospirillum caucaseum]|uniref:Outer membrane protein n=1 Tax=Paramagnetospirillum caucaseum TaxID=1244869 RepID=M2Z7M4_9PROT|nr:lipid A deacylase LpxR family protein [Paramagnetospirillum caucaseum]EME70325.1 hypothetical protein H261_09068 [Paramagnetospirillum caucaseum]